MNAAVDPGSRGPQHVGPAAEACVLCVVKIFGVRVRYYFWWRHNKKLASPFFPLYLQCVHGEESSLLVPIKCTVKKGVFLFEIVHCSGEGQKRLKGATQRASGCCFQAVVHDPAAHLPPNRPEAEGGGRCEGM